jgi:hypothetical protein
VPPAPPRHHDRIAAMRQEHAQRLRRVHHRPRPFTC